MTCASSYLRIVGGAHRVGAVEGQQVRGAPKDALLYARAATEPKVLPKAGW